MSHIDFPLHFILGGKFPCRIFLTFESSDSETFILDQRQSIYVC